MVRLGADLLDDAAQMGIEVVSVDPARRLADVDAQVGGALDLGDDLDRRDDSAKVTRHRRLERDDAEARLLEFERLGVDVGVAEEHVLGRPRGPAPAGCRSPGGSTR